MSGLARKTSSVFGASLTPSGNIAQFASKAIGSPAFSNDPQLIQTSQWQQGWSAAVAAGNAPYLEDDNGVQYVLSYLIAYLQARGIPEWDYNTSGGASLTTYNRGDIVRRGPNSGGPNITLYQCQADNITSDPLTDSNNWTPLAQTLIGPNTFLAKVVFDGGATVGTNCVILGTAFNVSSVYKNATGNYTINFTNRLPVDGSGNGVYGLAGSAGAQNGTLSLNGDNNIVNGGGFPGTVVTKTATACQVFNWEANLSGAGGLEDSQSISVIFF